MYSIIIIYNTSDSYCYSINYYYYYEFFNDDSIINVYAILNFILNFMKQNPQRFFD